MQSPFFFFLLYVGLAFLSSNLDEVFVLVLFSGAGSSTAAKIHPPATPFVLRQNSVVVVLISLTASHYTTHHCTSAAPVKIEKKRKERKKNLIIYIFLLL